MPACSAGSMETSRPGRRSWSRTELSRKSPACRHWRSRRSSVRRSSPQRLVHRRLDDRAIELDGLHDLVMRQRADAQLQAKAVMFEPLVLHQDLVDDLLGRAHEIGALRRRAGIELGASGWRPAAFLADTAHSFAMGGKGDVTCILAIGRDEAV